MIVDPKNGKLNLEMSKFSDPTTMSLFLLVVEPFSAGEWRVLRFRGFK